MDSTLLFPSKYLRAADLAGKDAVLQIAKVQVDALQMAGGKKENRPVIYFNNTEKMMVVNKTNVKVIAKQLGKDTDSWTGQNITVFPTTTKFGRDTVDCIRVR